MPNGWIPGYEIVKIPGRPGLLHKVDIPPRYVLHTTEGTTAQSAINQYLAGTGCPHVTISFNEKRRVQHVPVTLGSYALKDAPGGAETNEGAIIQVEIVGYARNSWQMEDDELEWIGTQLGLIAEEMEEVGLIAEDFDLLWPQFFDHRSGFTLATRNAKQRKTVAQWNSDTWTVYGHQHVGESNEHWDPGILDMVAINRAFEKQFSSASTPDPDDEDEKLAFTDRRQNERITKAREANARNAVDIKDMKSEMVEVRKTATLALTRAELASKQLHELKDAAARNGVTLEELIVLLQQGLPDPPVLQGQRSQ